MPLLNYASYEKTGDLLCSEPTIKYFHLVSQKFLYRHRQTNHYFLLIFSVLQAVL